MDQIVRRMGQMVKIRICNVCESQPDVKHFPDMIETGFNIYVSRLWFHL